MGVAGYLVFSVINNINSLRNKIHIEKQLTEYKLMFFTNISHEFRTPLTLIQGALDKLRTENLSPNESAYSLNIMDKSTRRMLRLINQLLEFRKMQNNKLTLSLEEIDIIPFLKDIFNNFSETAAAKNMEYVFMSPVSSYMNFIVKNKLDKVIYTILSNAFKYTPKGGEIEVLIKSKNNNNLSYVNISIKDTGCGIPTSFLPYIFDRFSSNSYNKKVESNGIGLALVKDLINLHKGTVEVESAENKGTKFIIELPVDELCYINERINVSKINKPVIENEDSK